MLLISSKTSSSQCVLGLPIGLFDMGFYLLYFLTLLSSAVRSTWPKQLNLCILINPIMFCPLITSLISWLVLNLQMTSSDLVTKNFPHDLSFKDHQFIYQIFLKDPCLAGVGHCWAN
jgi:hypothetical protein